MVTKTGSVEKVKSEKRFATYLALYSNVVTTGGLGGANRPKDFQQSHKNQKFYKATHFTEIMKNMRLIGVMN